MTTNKARPNFEPSLEEKAEEVRAYLVAVRGGAPFLSAADGRLLVRWLEQGFSVARILAGVDETAAKRRKKMTRGRLTLTACRRGIEGRSQAKDAKNETKPSTEAIDFSGLIREITDMEVPAKLRSAKNDLLDALQSLHNTDDPEFAATTAVTACRHFQEAAWLAAEDEHSALRAQAMEDLAALRNVLSPAALHAAMDEVAHDLIRRRYPLVSAKAVWDRVSAV